MLTELRPKSQITIPKEIISSLGLSEGDTLDISVHGGAIHILPVSVYPKDTLSALRKEVDAVKKKLADGSQPVFDNLDALFDRLEEKE